MGWTQSICNKQQEELAPTAIPHVMEVDANVLAKKSAMTKQCLRLPQTYCWVKIITPDATLF